MSCAFVSKSLFYGMFVNLSYILNKIWPCSNTCDCGSMTTTKPDKNPSDDNSTDKTPKMMDSDESPIWYLFAKFKETVVISCLKGLKQIIDITSDYCY